MELPGHSQGDKGQSCLQVLSYRQTDKVSLAAKANKQKDKVYEAVDALIRFTMVTFFASPIYLIIFVFAIYLRLHA